MVRHSRSPTSGRKQIAEELTTTITETGPLMYETSDSEESVKDLRCVFTTGVQRSQLHHFLPFELAGSSSR